MRVRFWGVRGSVPWTGAQSGQVGTNTPCVEVADPSSGRKLILDAGTGIVGMSSGLMAGTQPVVVLLSHYHWDHIQGLPFFEPLFAGREPITVLGPALAGARPSWLAGLFRRPYFPVSLDELPAPPAVSFVDLAPFEANGFPVRACPLRHPGGSYAYRVASRSGDIVYATDHEFGDAATDAALGAFAAGAAAVIMDAHHTPQELAGAAGRGHGSWRQCAEFAAACGVGRLWLFHHRPGRTDAELRQIEADARAVFASTTVAREGADFLV